MYIYLEQELLRLRDRSSWNKKVILMGVATDLALCLIGDVLIATPLLPILNILIFRLSPYNIEYNHIMETCVHVQKTHSINDKQILDNEVPNDSFVLCCKHLWLEHSYLAEGDEHSVQVTVIIVQMGNQGLQQNDS